MFPLFVCLFIFCSRGTLTRILRGDKGDGQEGEEKGKENKEKKSKKGKGKERASLSLDTDDKEAKEKAGVYVVNETTKLCRFVLA